MLLFSFGFISGCAVLMALRVVLYNVNKKVDELKNDVG
jgi:hypothetical protein